MEYSCVIGSGNKRQYFLNGHPIDKSNIPQGVKIECIRYSRLMGVDDKEGVGVEQSDSDELSDPNEPTYAESVISEPPKSEDSAFLDIPTGDMYKKFDASKIGYNRPDLDIFSELPKLEIPPKKELSPIASDCIKKSKLELKPHQIKVVKFMDTHESLLIVHATGSGKTLT